jgi:hypothetical protein
VRSLFSAAVLCLLTGTSLWGQQNAPSGVQRRGWDAFGVEAAGGIVGATLGYGVVVALHDECTQDGDLVSCAIGPAALALGSSTLGAALGTVVAGRAGKTGVSVAGATLGALVGAVAAVGVHHLLNEEMSVRTSTAGTTIIVGLTQGITAALTSRLFAGWSR